MSDLPLELQFIFGPVCFALMIIGCSLMSYDIYLRRKGKAITDKPSFSTKGDGSN